MVIGDAPSREEAMATYIAIVHKGSRDANFGVSFPDFPGCVTAGHTLSDAMTMAREALVLHVKGMIVDGELIPAPTLLDDIMADPVNRSGVAMLVEAAEAKPTVERVNITLDKRLLQAIDDRAATEGMSRSGFIATVVKCAIEGTPTAHFHRDLTDDLRRAQPARNERPANSASTGGRELAPRPREGKMIFRGPKGLAKSRVKPKGA
jgi:predicted RNase H-like HicB family nuclease